MKKKMLVSAVHCLSGNNLTKETTRRNEKFLEDVINLSDGEKQFRQPIKTLALVR